MAHDSRAVANYFIQKSLKEPEYLTTMQVLKLVYIAHGWCLAGLKGPLVSHSVEAWQYGPVIPVLYDSLKQFGRYPIKQLIAKEDSIELLLSGKDGTPVKTQFSEHEKGILDKTWDIYKSFSGYQLSNLTHKDGTPWEQIYEPNTRDLIIPEALIKEYYENLITNPASPSN